MSRRHYAAFPITSVKALDEDAGTFEAIVSVFDNVDFAGDRIIEGAFANSLERWKASGDPIPVIWSHQWHDPAAYIGSVDPSNIAELAAGDPELPEAIRDLGGLKVKANIDTDDPMGAKVQKLLKSRAVREFSFAYDVVEEAKNDDDNINELLEVDLIEVGPTLKGANPLTELIGAKALDTSELLELAKAIDVELTTDEEEVDSKTLADLAGIIDRLDTALKAVGLEVFITKAGARNSAVDESRIQKLHDLTGDLGAKCVEPDGATSRDDDGKAGDYLDPAVLGATLDAELIEATD